MARTVHPRKIGVRKRRSAPPAPPHPRAPRALQERVMRALRAYRRARSFLDRMPRRERQAAETYLSMFLDLTAGMDCHALRALVWAERTAVEMRHLQTVLQAASAKGYQLHLVRGRKPLKGRV